MGRQGGFTKFPCYLYHWDSRDTNVRHHRRIWRKRTEFSVGKTTSNIIRWDPIINSSKILMPPLHIKFSVVKQFVKALERSSEAFKYLLNFFPKLSKAKIKADAFIGPQIRKILECIEFFEKLSTKGRAAFNSFAASVQGFLEVQNVT